MDEQRLRTIENVTANFFFWQGLRWVPMGIVLLAWVAIPISNLAVVLATLALALWISARFGRYYSRTYGHVHGLGNARREWWKWNFVYPAMVASLIADGLWKPDVLLTGPVWAAAIVLYWNSTGRGRLHYLVIAGVIAATGALPLLGVAPGKPAINVFFGVLGAAYVIGGLLDHFELTRILDGRTV